MEPIKKENLSPETVEKLSKNKMPPFMNLDLISVPADKIPLDLSKKTNEQNPVPGVSKKTNESFKMDINKSQNVGKKSFVCDVCSKSFTKRKVCFAIPARGRMWRCMIFATILLLFRYF